MIQVTVKIKDTGFKTLDSLFSRSLGGVLDGIRRDMHLLGLQGLAYLHSIIPASNLNRPHLRDSFRMSTRIISSSAVRLHIYSLVPYALFVNYDARVPTRYPRRAKVMRFISDSGDVVFTKRAKGFTRKGIFFIQKTEAWLALHVADVVDFTLKKYLNA